jgi:hypothetical protein
MFHFLACVNWQLLGLDTDYVSLDFAIYSPKRDHATAEKMSRAGSLKLQSNLVITVGIIFKHGIGRTLLNIGSGQIWAGSPQRQLLHCVA